ncbi:MAG: hypothetical protein COX65_02410 [Elusimicrobia bacterium CG_4_10_14_0_2_um_filter_56_8]|nr:MAG: hypothetical protein AUJ51_07440 [Elusimicrobia bacterium CG1_02_56_21]PJA16496.1 MAG: hypothetical protein COX65_02410 [Elusimicrobia bacterium CG_4_10_14_0_2_um_filter_56_8]
MKRYWPVFTLVAALGCLYFAGRSLHSVTSVKLFQNIAPGTVFYSEDPSNLRLSLFKKAEGLEALVKGLGTDLEKASRLRAWAAGMKWAKNYPDPYPPWDALTLLDWIRSGKTGGHCGQRGIVFGQACQALGIPVRYADLAAKDNAGGHFTVEVYIKELGKWIVMDPTFNYSFKEKDKFLSGREVHERLVGGTAGGVRLEPVQGPAETRAQLGLYYYYRYYLRNNFLSEPAVINSIAHDEGGVEISFEEKRLHLDDTFTRDKAFRSSHASGLARDFDWQYRDLGIVPAHGYMRTLLIDSKNPAARRCLISVNGSEIAARLPFQVKLAAGRANTVVVTDPGKTFGTIITLKPLW